METTTKIPSIAEIWLQFEQMSITGNPCYIHSREGEQWEAMFRSLRQQLVERCTTHDFHWLEPQSKASITPDQWIDYHKDNAAYHAFWAWEIEQQKNSANHG